MVGKIVVLEHKSGHISETREDRGKVTMGAYRNSQTLFRIERTTPDLLRPPLPQDWGFATPPQKPKTPIAVISGTAKATDFEFGQNIHRVHPNKNPLKIVERGAWANQGTVQNF